MDDDVGFTPPRRWREGIATTKTDWRNGLTGLGVSARLSVLMQGLRERVKAMLNIGSGSLRLTDNRLPFRLNNRVNKNILSLDAAAPANCAAMYPARILPCCPAGFCVWSGCFRHV